MEKGRFSQPRSHREEERQIEETFRQITEKKPSKRRLSYAERYSLSDVSDESVTAPAEEVPVQEEAPIPWEIPMEEDPSQAAEDPIENTDETEPSREDEWEEYEGSGFQVFLNRLMELCLTHWKAVLIGLGSAVAGMLVILIALMAGDAPAQSEDVRILNNVMIADIHVGGMTQQEARQAVNRAANDYSTQDMVVDIAGSILRLSPQDTKAVLDVDSAVAAALAYGHTGTKSEQEQALADSRTQTYTIGLLPYLQLDTGFILKELESHASGTGSTLTQPSYVLEGASPSLQADTFRPDSAQTLVLTMGTPGIRFRVDKVYDQILDAYSLRSFLVSVTETEAPIEPDPIDIQAIYDKLYVAPVDSRIDMQTFQVIPGSYGYDFDLDAAKTLVAYANYAEVIRIPMRFIEPERMDDTILFQDILGEYQLSTGSDSDRIYNMQLACQAINGITVQPGQTFSFLDALGGSQSYADASVDLSLNTDIVSGGGISQVSSALYCCAMMADMEIISRTNHTFPTDFADYGMDAAVHWDGPDLSFRNSNGYPIQISASVSGGYLTLQLLGSEQRDYFIKLEHEVTNVQKPDTEYVDFPFENAEGYLDGDVIQEGIPGYSAKTYKLKYSRSTGRLISKDFEATTRYSSAPKYIARVAPPETTVPETTVPVIIVPDEPSPTVTEPAQTEPVVILPEETQPEVTVSEETMSENDTFVETQASDQAA